MDDKTEAEIAKLNAETAEIKARMARAATVGKQSDERVAIRAALAEAQMKAAQEYAVIAWLRRAEAERKEQAAAASDERNGRYRFFGTVCETNVRLCMNRMIEWDKTHPTRDMEIIFTSGGGDATNGFALFDFIQSMKRPDRTIYTSTLGMAASMAGILLQAGDVRVMGRQATLMIHEASFEVEGPQKTGEAETRVEWIKSMQERVLDIFASRSAMTQSQIRNKWKNKDWYIDSTAALKLKFVDEVRPVLTGLYDHPIRAADYPDEIR